MEISLPPPTVLLITWYTTYFYRPTTQGTIKLFNILMNNINIIFKVKSSNR